MKNKKELELYLHIPFCRSKCAYCDFLSQPGEEDLIRDYVSRLLEDIWLSADAFRDYCVCTVFFGGGTPSYLSAGHIDRLMEAVRAEFTLDPDAEITLECNPGTLSREKLAIYKSAGINRLSMGVQSANDRELSMLGRIHTFSDVLENYEAARKTGFSNISMDLIQGLPQQTVSAFLESVKKVLMLRPEHLSVYSLIIEEGTRFYDLYHIDDEARQRGEEPVVLPSEEADREMYHKMKALLEKNGYHRYEISNFCRPDFACRHNIGYWKRKEYLGLGLGAASLIGERRFHRTAVLAEYLRGDFSHREEEQLSRKAQMEELMFLGLRMEQGVSKAEFYDHFGIALTTKYKEAIASLKKEGLLLETADGIALTDKGFDLANPCMASFLS